MGSHYSRQLVHDSVLFPQEKPLLFFEKASCFSSTDVVHLQVSNSHIKSNEKGKLLDVQDHAGNLLFQVPHRVHWIKLDQNDILDAKNGQVLFRISSKCAIFDPKDAMKLLFATKNISFRSACDFSTKVPIEFQNERNLMLTLRCGTGDQAAVFIGGKNEEKECIAKMAEHRIQVAPNVDPVLILAFWLIRREYLQQAMAASTVVF
jgi:hypothetical protein